MRWRAPVSEISLADIVEAVEGPIVHDHVRGWRESRVRCSTRIAG